MKKYIKVLLFVIVFFVMKSRVNASPWSLFSKDVNLNSSTCGPYVYLDGDLNNVIWGNGHGSVYLGISQVNNNLDSVVSVNMGDLHIDYTFGYLDNYKVDYNKSCPKYIGTNKNETFGYADDGFKFYVSDDRNDLKNYQYIFTYIDSKNFTSCGYNTVVNSRIYFNLFVNEDKSKKILLPSFDGHGKLSNGITVDYIQIADAWSREDKIVNGACPQICIADSNSIRSFVTDSFVLEQNHSDSDKKCVSALENADNSISVCYLYSLFMDKIESFYSNSKTCDKSKDEYCYVPYILAADKQISEINELCTQVFKVQNYKDSCVIKCLDFSNDLGDLKNKYGIKNTGSACNLSARIIKFIANILKWLKYIAPVLAIILGILDFVKAIASQSDDEMKKAQGKFVKRLIAAALLFIVPFIIEFILDKFNMAKDNPFCNLL